MSARRVVVADTPTSTLNERFRKIQDAKEKKIATEPGSSLGAGGGRKTSTGGASTRASTGGALRSVSMTRPLARGITKPRLRGAGTRARGSEVVNGGRPRSGVARGGGIGRRSATGGIRTNDGKGVKMMSNGRTTSGGRGGRGRGGSGRGRSTRAGGIRGGRSREPTSKAALDNDLESYMLEDEEKGKGRLDSELEEYMSRRATQPTSSSSNGGSGGGVGTSTTTTTTTEDDHE